ncbi:SapC family protein [Campylobacter sp. 19-13652]|uniref:SapC family protein n=1 Tax=Campylobacter sp. 19-13652 TaxID=2840180 RepID=UPI001C782822|nr:SapC family protein [Campylobacter sp. 19-13652]BCX79790.1 hypothetical protein LBC_12520 [Campylobacter sp. 19-13652]
MGRAIRNIESGCVFIKQKGEFFLDDDEKKLYSNTLTSLAKKNDTQVFGYALADFEVVLFLQTQNAPKFMQTLNSTFVRGRNKLRKEPAKSNIKRYEIRAVSLDEFDDLLAYIAHVGGYTFANINKDLSLYKRIEIEKFKKRTQMRLVALNPSQHKNLSYHQDMMPQFPFAQIVASESVACERDFAIVFTNDVVPRLVVLFGKDSNILVDQNFKGYLPASVKNYPFSLAEVGGEQVLCIDENAPQLSGGGERLFNDDDTPTEFLGFTINAMRNYNLELERTNVALEEIRKTGILVNKELSVNIDDKKVTLIKGFSVVSRKKLNELDDATLANFARRGYLELINSHLRSLVNLENLAARIIENENR